MNYSTPCLFAAQTAIEAAMSALKARDGEMDSAGPGGINLKGCTQLLSENLMFRDQMFQRTPN